MNDGLGRPPEREDFDAWAVSAGFAERDSAGRVWFYRNGGDGLWEGYCAGARAQRGRDAIASRDHMNAVLTDIAIIRAPAQTRIKILTTDDPGLTQAAPTESTAVADNVRKAPLPFGIDLQK